MMILKERMLCFFKTIVSWFRKIPRTFVMVGTFAEQLASHKVKPASVHVPGFVTIFSEYTQIHRAASAVCGCATCRVTFFLRRLIALDIYTT